MALGILALGIMALGILALGIMALGKMSCNQLKQLKKLQTKFDQPLLIYFIFTSLIIFEVGLARQSHKEAIKLHNSCYSCV